MTKVKHATSSHKRKKRTLKAMKGAHGATSKLLKTAKEAGRKALVYNYSGRKNKKRDFRSLWIARITAACREEGVSYSKFIAGLKTANIELNRKVLADLAATDNKAFKTLVEKSKV